MEMARKITLEERDGSEGTCRWAYASADDDNLHMRRARGRQGAPKRRRFQLRVLLEEVEGKATQAFTVTNERNVYSGVVARLPKVSASSH